MSDPEAPTEVIAPATETPPAPAPVIDVEAIKSELTSSFDAKLNERIAGIQSSYQRQLNEKEEEIRTLKLGAMSDSERARFEEDEGKNYVADLEKRVVVGEIARKFPQIADAFEKLLGAESPEKQAEILLALTQPAAPATPAAPEPAENVPAVDPNNPAPTGGTATEARLPDGTPITEESAIAFLTALGDTPIGGYR